jgi:hypothetical protein
VQKFSIRYKPCSTTPYKDDKPRSSWFHSRNARVVHISKSINVIQHITINRVKNHEDTRNGRNILEHEKGYIK